MDACIAIIMYCHILFLLFTGKQHCLHYEFYRGGGDLPATNICLHAKFQVRWCYGFGSTALQQDEAEEGEDKGLEKTCFAVFPRCYVEIYLFLVNLFFFVCFRHS